MQCYNFGYFGADYDHRNSDICEKEGLKNRFLIKKTSKGVKNAEF
jgi:hypothetical protein